MSQLSLLDSSGWIEYFAEGPNAERFAPVVDDTSSLLVPTIVLHEVYRWADLVFAAHRDGCLQNIQSGIELEPDIIGGGVLSIDFGSPKKAGNVLITRNVFSLSVADEPHDQIETSRCRPPNLTFIIPLTTIARGRHPTFARRPRLADDSALYRLLPVGCVEADAAVIHEAQSRGDSEVIALQRDGNAVRRQCKLRSVSLRPAEPW
jgi:hypothetical protein